MPPTAPLSDATSLPASDTAPPGCDQDALIEAARIEARRHRELADRCRQRAHERSLAWERRTLLEAAEEFERLARQADARADALFTGR